MKEKRYYCNLIDGDSVKTFEATEKEVEKLRKDGKEIIAEEITEHEEDEG